MASAAILLQSNAVDIDNWRYNRRDGWNGAIKSAWKENEACAGQSGLIAKQWEGEAGE